MDAARAQVDEHGLESLSSRTLAARLEVTPMALYRHVADMDEVMGAMVDRLLSDIGVPEPDQDWRRWIEGLAQGLRGLLREHPVALALMTRRPITTPAARERLDRALEVLMGAGFTNEQATQAYAAVHTYTIGYSALDEGRRRTPSPSGPLDASGDARSAAIRGFVSEDHFIYGLHALIRGLDHGDPDR